MRSLREKKLYHAVAKGCEPRFVGIYTDYNMMSQAVSGRATSKHLSSRTIEEAVQFMSEHDVDDIRVIFVNKEGQKESYSVSKYKSDILGMASPVSREEGAEVDEHVLNDLLTETISFPADDDEIDSLLEDTIKECEKSVLSWMSAPSDVITQSPRPDSSLSVANQLDGTRNQTKGSDVQSPRPESSLSVANQLDGTRNQTRGIVSGIDVLVTSTPFRENVTANISNISRIEDSHTEIAGEEVRISQEREVQSDDTHQIPSSFINTGSQTEMAGEEIGKLKSELAKLKSQKKALIGEKDALMKKNVGLRKANDILVKRCSKVSSLKKELQSVQKQKNHLVKEKKRLESLLQEADCLFAANVMKDDSGFMQEEVMREKTSGDPSVDQSVNQLPEISHNSNLQEEVSQEGQQSRICPSSEHRDSIHPNSHGTIHFPPNLLPADLEAWLSPRMHTPEEFPESSSPPSSQANEDANLSDPEMNVWMSSQLPFLDRTLEAVDEPAEHQLSDSSLTPVKFKLEGNYPELSNLRHCRPKLSVYGKKFRSKEHAYQWKKALVHNIPQYAERIRKAHSAKKAMSLDRKIVTSEEWKKRNKIQCHEGCE